MQCYICQEQPSSPSPTKALAAKVEGADATAYPVVSNALGHCTSEDPYGSGVPGQHEDRLAGVT